MPQGCSLEGSHSQSNVVATKNIQLGRSTKLLGNIWVWINTYQNTIKIGGYSHPFTIPALLVLTHCHIVKKKPPPLNCTSPPFLVTKPGRQVSSTGWWQGPFVSPVLGGGFGEFFVHFLVPGLVNVHKKRWRGSPCYECVNQL